MSTSASSTFVSQKHETFTTFNDVVSHHVFDSNPATTFSEGVADIKTTKEVPVFQPKKFVPMSNTTNDGFSQPASALGMKAKWSPFGNQKNEPSYRKIQPNLSSKTSESNQPSLFKKSPQSATCAVGEKVGGLKLKWGFFLSLKRWFTGSLWGWTILHRRTRNDLVVRVQTDGPWWTENLQVWGESFNVRNIPVQCRGFGNVQLHDCDAIQHRNPILFFDCPTKNLSVPLNLLTHDHERI